MSTFYDVFRPFFSYYPLAFSFISVIIEQIGETIRRREKYKMLRAILFVLIGYISGSVTYIHIFSALLKKGDIVSMSPDKNPGSANAFTYGGFACGCLTLCFELLKGFVPVWLYMHTTGASSPCAVTFVVLAPVVGHAFSIFHGFRGGKGIAASFGALLGLMPMWLPAVTLAFFFIFFSVVLRVTPNFYRTLAAYIVSTIVLIFGHLPFPVWLGFAAISAVVTLKLHMSAEEREKVKVKLLWMD